MKKENVKCLIVGVFIGIFITALLGYFSYKLNQKNKTVSVVTEIRKCNYEIKDLKEYKGSYGDWEDYYIVYEGIIKNNSDKAESLNAMIGKIYNEKDVYLAEGYTSFYGKILEPGKSIPFKVQANVSKHDTALRKYYESSKILKPEIYPWFMNCK